MRTAREMFGKPSPPPPPPDDEPPPPFDYAAEVERQIRIMDSAFWAEMMWARMLTDYTDEARRQRYV